MKNGCREILVKVVILYVWDVGPNLMISYLLDLKLYIYLYRLIYRLPRFEGFSAIVSYVTYSYIK